MYYDYHTHSDFSDDSETPLRDMLDAAVRLGISEIAVTDHYDPGYPDRDFPFELKFEDYQNILERYREEYSDRLKIARGIEIGIQHTELENCGKAAASYDYDYIIGSFHCALGEPLYAGHFYDEKTPKQAFVDYFTYVYDNISSYREYSCLGHLNLVARYIDTVPDFRDYSDICEAVLKTAISDGKGIELNTSSFRYNMPSTCPSEEILRLYRDMGGEIITTGSDAHTADMIADHFKYSYEYLQSLGFKYICTFKHREPVFHTFEEALK